MSNIGTMLSSLMRGKVLVTTVVAALTIGGGTAFAATSTGQQVVQTLTGIHATVTPTHHTDPKADSDKASSKAKATEDADKDDSKSCPGQPEAQQLATKFSLSTGSKSSSMQVICTLHDGTFQGVDHALGYGEIDQLLTFAQSLAKKGNATLSDSNVQTFVATALKNCGSTPIVVCVNTNLPDNHSTGSGNSGAKPTVTPDPHGGKPTGAPTPHAN